MARIFKLSILIAILLVPIAGGHSGPSLAGPSPEDSEILVVSRYRSSGGCPGGPYNCSHILTLDPATRNTNVVATEYGLTRVGWSPDGSRVAYVKWRDTDDDPSIVVVNTDGSNRFDLVMPGRGEAGVEWSPDGTQLVYSHRVGMRRSVIYRREARFGSDEQRVSNPNCECHDEGPEWSPDGKLIAYERDGTILVSRVGGAVIRRFSVQGTSVHNQFLTHAAWRPSSKRLFVYGYRKGKVWIARLGDGSMQELTPPDRVRALGRLSPDGDQLLVLRRRCDKNGCASEVWVMDPAGQNRLKLTDTPHEYESNPVWSPDGERIVFSRGTDYVDADLYVINSDGSDEELVYSTDGDNIAVGWRNI